MYEIRDSRNGKCRGIHSDLFKAQMKAHVISEDKGEAWVVGEGVCERHTWSMMYCPVCNPTTCVVCGELTGGADACSGCWDEAVQRGLI